jgi:hypothetical protein
MRYSFLSTLLIAVLLPVAVTARAIPATVEAADKEFPDRFNQVLGSWVDDLGTSKSDFGDWTSQGSMISLRRVAAALKAYELGRFSMPSNTPAVVETWLKNNVQMHEKVGTGGDYDFYLAQMAHILYTFRDKPNVLTNDAAWAMVWQKSPSNTTGFVPMAGQGVNYTSFVETGVTIGETENHVLMIAAWQYLVNQWIWMNYRNDSRIAGIRTSNHDNGGGQVEALLLKAINRIVHCGYFETNARAYQAFSIHPLMLLYSYANSEKVRTAARNALDFTALKYAFQSYEGRRYGLQRRNFEDYRFRTGLNENDYVPSIFGVLTGDYIKEGLLTSSNQDKGFALWACLSKYRIAPAIHDLMLNEDNHNAGYGYWGRFQDRFSWDHYPLNSAPYYEVDPAYPLPAPEFYFGSKNFHLSSGGEYVQYYQEVYVYDPGYNPIATNLAHWLNKSVSANLRKYDAFTKPSLLLTHGDNPIEYYPKQGEYVVGRNIGVFKNLLYGSQPISMGQLSYTELDRVNYTSGPVNYMLLRFWDFPGENFYAVSGEGKVNVSGTTLPYYFMEMVPKSSFSSSTAFVNTAKSLNPSLALENYTYFTVSGAYFPRYRLVQSGEVLVFNPLYQYGQGTYQYICADHTGPGCRTHKVGIPFIEKFPTYGRLGPISYLDASPPVEFHADMDFWSTIRNMPLIDVEQVDGFFQSTGQKYAYSTGNGYIAVSNPYLNQTINIDSRDYLNPLHGGNYQESALPTEIKRPNLIPILSLLLN